MISKNKLIISLLIIGLISISCISIVSATMDIYGGAFSTNNALDDLTYASIDVGSEYSNEDIIIQIWYSRDGSLLNNGNMVPKTVTSNGFINIKSADSYKYFPDNAEINIYDTNNNLLASQEVVLSPNKGIQTFGIGDYDDSYIKGSSSTINNRENIDTHHHNTIYHDNDENHGGSDSSSKSSSSNRHYPLFKPLTPHEQWMFDYYYDLYLSDNG